MPGKAAGRLVCATAPLFSFFSRFFPLYFSLRFSPVVSLPFCFSSKDMRLPCWCVLDGPPRHVSRFMQQAEVISGAFAHLGIKCPGHIQDSCWAGNNAAALRMAQTPNEAYSTQHKKICRATKNLILGFNFAWIFKLFW